jgi:tRNA threonylcarbamoyladenosine dehydratase
MGEKNMKQPIILPEKGFTQSDLLDLKHNQKVFEIVDIYDQQIQELFRILNPKASEKSQEFEHFKKERPAGDLAGTWIYYPWSGMLVHTLGQKELFAIRTNRNQMLITKEEQQKLKDSVVGITGMSVGAGMAVSLAYSGISETIKIADFDELDTSNLNRLREGLSSVGKPKVNLAAQNIYEVNPFANVQAFEKGIDDNNIDQFFTEPNLNVVIDEIDDFKIKVQLRKQAKKYSVPVLMFSSLGDNILIDIERYDTEPELPIFHGLLGDLTDEITNNPNITEEDEKKYAVLLVGQEYVPTRALATLIEMGKTLVGRPQLYSTVAVDSGLSTYLVRKIINGDKLASGRYFVKFSELFDLESVDLADTPERQEILKKLLG